MKEGLQKASENRLENRIGGLLMTDPPMVILPLSKIHLFAKIEV